jgi:hypothetical protein
MGEVVAHVFELECLEVGAADDTGGEGTGGVVEETIDEGELTAEHDGHEGGGVEIELGEGVQLSEDIEAHEVGLVDEKDGDLFCGADRLTQEAWRESRTILKRRAEEKRVAGAPSSRQIWRSSSSMVPVVAMRLRMRYWEGWRRLWA